MRVLLEGAWLPLSLRIAVMADEGEVRITRAELRELVNDATSEAVRSHQLAAMKRKLSEHIGQVEKVLCTEDNAKDNVIKVRNPSLRSSSSFDFYSCSLD